MTNETGGIDGKQIELLRYDDEANVDVARQRAEDIVAGRTRAPGARSHQLGGVARRR